MNGRAFGARPQPGAVLLDFRVDLFLGTKSQERRVDIADQRHLAGPLALHLDDVVRFRLDRVIRVDADVVQNGEDVIHLAIGVHEHLQAMGFRRRDQALHAMREDLAEHLGIDQQS